MTYEAELIVQSTTYDVLWLAYTPSISNRFFMLILLQITKDLINENTNYKSNLLTQSTKIMGSVSL